MDNLYDCKRFAILYVDDELTALKLFTLAFQNHFRILTASSARDGLKLLEQHKDEIGVLLADQRMPGEEGVWLLEKARQLRPRIIRILITAYADNQATIDAVNTGAIYKYLQKPVDPDQLRGTLQRALEFFMVQRERDQLLTEKMAFLQNMMVADRMISFGLLTAGLSHHIRNPLVAVKTFLDLAPSKMEEEKAHLEGLRHPDFWHEFHHKVQGQLVNPHDLPNDRQMRLAGHRKKLRSPLHHRQNDSLHKSHEVPLLPVAVAFLLTMKCRGGRAFLPRRPLPCRCRLPQAREAGESLMPRA